MAGLNLHPPQSDLEGDGFVTDKRAAYRDIGTHDMADEMNGEGLGVRLVKTAPQRRGNKNWAEQISQLFVKCNLPDSLVSSQYLERIRAWSQKHQQDDMGASVEEVRHI